MSNTPPWLQEPALQQFFSAVRDAGGEARAVGGCVRDWLMGEEGADVDMACTLTPQQTMDIAAQQGWKSIPTGLAHGTVTLVLPERILEVTTLRRDVATDGRHATVAFTDSWQEDAARRDFTFNALFMDAEGNITDFFAGQADLGVRQVRFIGDAARRITEDALRMLRYFRFLATHGKPPADAAALAAIAAHKALLAQLSGERMANEMRKLLAAEAPAYALRLLAGAGLAPLIFDTEIDPSRMIRLQLLESRAAYQCSVWARLLVVCAGGEVVAWITQRWKISRHEQKQVALLAILPPLDVTAPRHVHTRILRLHGAPAYLDWVLMHAALQSGVDVAPHVALAQDFVPPKFPLTAQDLLAQGMVEGKALGDKLAELERRWEESDYGLSKAELLAVLSE